MQYDLTNNKISETYGRVVQIVSGSYYDGLGNVLPIGTSSVVISASTANFATTGSNTFNGNQTISGSVIVTNGITGSLLGTSSYSLNSISSSYALTASYSDYAATAGLSQNAQDILIYVKNTSGAIIPKGKVVRITGVDNSANFGTIALADYSNDANSANTLGFTNESFAINAFGYVMTEGYLLGVNTDGFTSGDILYLSSSGTYTNVTPVAPKHGVRLGQAIRVQLNNGSIYVNIDNGAELGELHDIVDSTTTGSYGDLLVKSGSIWINSKNLTGSYTLSGSLTTNNDIIANSITSSLYGTSSWSNNSLTTSYAILTNVSMSLNFANDTDAAIGGVPLGGLYRNGNAILIRIV